MGSLFSTTIFSTLIVLFFVLPGFIFRHSFFKIREGFLSTNSIYNELIWGLIIAFFMYSVSLSVTNWIIPQLQITLENIKSVTLSKNLDIVVASFIAHGKKIGFQFLIANLLAWLAGKLVRNIVFAFRLDIKISALQFDNNWHYILSGRQLLFDESKSHLFDEDNFELELNILSEAGGTAMVYSGKIDDYKLKDKSLDYISLYVVRRYVLIEKDGITVNVNAIGEALIGGDFMIFKYSDIKNINVQYKELPSTLKAIAPPAESPPAGNQPAGG